MGQIHPQAWLDPTASLDQDVYVGPFSVVEAGVQLGQGCRIGPHCYLGPGVRLGQHCHLEAGCVVLAGSQLGDGVQLAAGVVIGAAGFGFVLHQGQHLPIPQVSGVEIGSRSCIGPGSCIDRGTLQPTYLGDEVVLGAQVQLAHNVRVGSRSQIHDQAGIAGSSQVGEDCQMGFQSGMAGQASLGDRSRLAIRGGNLRKAPPESDLWGFPARPKREALRAQAALHRLARGQETKDS